MKRIQDTIKEEVIMSYCLKDRNKNKNKKIITPVNV